MIAVNDLLMTSDALRNFFDLNLYHYPKQSSLLSKIKEASASGEPPIGAGPSREEQEGEQSSPEVHRLPMAESQRAEPQPGVILTTPNWYSRSGRQSHPAVVDPY